MIHIVIPNIIKHSLSVLDTFISCIQFPLHKLPSSTYLILAVKADFLSRTVRNDICLMVKIYHLYVRECRVCVCRCGWLGVCVCVSDCVFTFECVIVCLWIYVHVLLRLWLTVKIFVYYSNVHMCYIISVILSQYFLLECLAIRNFACYSVSFSNLSTSISSVIYISQYISIFLSIHPFT